MRSAVLGLGLLVASVVYADVVSQNGIAKDSATGLTWQDNEEVKTLEQSFYKAEKYCPNLKLGGFSDWRMPSIYELMSLLDNRKKSEPFIINGIKNGIKNINAERYWSSTEKSTGNNWLVDFHRGIIDSDYNQNRGQKYIRCVRGQKLSFDALSSLHKKGVVQVSQENINEISATVESQKKADEMLKSLFKDYKK